MMPLTLSRLARFAAIMFACHLLAGEARAQQPVAPSAGAVAAARELVEIKGGNAMFDPAIKGIIDQTKGTLMTMNPQLSRDLAEVGTRLEKELQPRRSELMNAAANYYAQRFSEQELKDLVTFYKSALGKKMIAQEPQVLDDTFNFIQEWSKGPFSEDVMGRFRVEMKKKGHDL